MRCRGGQPVPERSRGVAKALLNFRIIIRQLKQTAMKGKRTNKCKFPDHNACQMRIPPTTMLVKCNFPDHYAGHVQLRAAERRPVGRKRMMKDQPSAVVFAKTVTDRLGRKG